jgi:hypothetical protein
MPNQVTANFNWPRPDPLGLQRAEITRVDQALNLIDSKAKTIDNTIAALTAAFNTHSHTFASLTSKPSTLAGYGITDAYTKAETDSEIAQATAALVDSAPGALDTLKEFATALGNDPNFATTITAQISLKLNAAAYTAGDVLAKLLTVDGAGTGLDADRVDGLHASQFLRSDADSNLIASIIVPDTARNRGIVGTYDPYKTQQIWAMGMSYLSAADGSTFGALYGLAYKHTYNTTGGTLAGGHQMVWCQAGTPTAALGSGLWTSGDIKGLSDERVKTNKRRITDPLKKIRQLAGWIYDRTDTGAKNEVGLIAQAARKAMPQLVSGDERKGLLSLKYNGVVTLTVEAVIAIDALVTNQAAEIEKLKKRLTALEAKRG